MPCENENGQQTGPSTDAFQPKFAGCEGHTANFFFLVPHSIGTAICERTISERRRETCSMVRVFGAPGVNFSSLGMCPTVPTPQQHPAAVWHQASILLVARNLMTYNHKSTNIVLRFEERKVDYSGEGSKQAASSPKWRFSRQALA